MHMATSFSVTWDYLCPFARNAHEHLVTALRSGPDWDVKFRFFSLSQAHVPEGGQPVWDKPEAASGVLAGLAGIVVRDKYPEKFLDVHEGLFAARHDKAQDLRDRAAVQAALDEAGVDGKAVLEEALSGWPAEKARQEHTEAVDKLEVFGVPTFIVGDRAVFVRVMNRPRGDAKLAESTIDKVLDLVDGFPELNEYKFTRVPR
jgi:DSBA-like thioredoxin domain